MKVHTHIAVITNTQIIYTLLPPSSMYNNLYFESVSRIVDAKKIQRHAVHSSM